MGTRLHVSALPALVLLLLLLLLSLLFYHPSIQLFPAHIHAWTQADRYAIALKFLDNGFNLFKPQTFNLHTREGVTAVDFPLHEWLIACWMKILGSRSPAIFRIHVLVVSLLGNMAVFAALRRLTASWQKAFIMSLFIFCAPVISYYQTGFLPSATALATTFGSWYFWIRYWQQGRPAHLYLGIGLLTLAALLRKPFVIFLFATCLQHCYHCWRSRSWKVHEMGAFALAFAAFLAYLAYNWWLTHTYGSMFLNALLPARSWSELKEVTTAVLGYWHFQYFTPWHYLLAALLMGWAGISWWKKRELSPIHQKLALQALLYLLAGIVYFLAMARQFVAHEYYFIDSLYPGIFLLLITCLALIRLPNTSSRWAFYSLASLMLLAACWQNVQMQREKYRIEGPGEESRRAFTGAQQWLDSLGVSPHARMLVLNAYSTNVPLILMNRMGYTLLITNDSTLSEAMQLDFDYAIVQDAFILPEVYTPYPQIIHKLQRVAGNGKLSLFVRRTTNTPGSLHDLLGIEPDRITQTDTLHFSLPPPPGWTLQIPVSEEKGMMEADMDFGPTFIHTFTQGAPNRLLFQGKLYVHSPGCKARIAVSIMHQQQLLYYRDYATPTSTSNWQEAALLFLLPHEIPAGSELKCYVWNPEHCKFDMSDFVITQYRF